MSGRRSLKMLVVLMVLASGSAAAQGSGKPGQQTSTANIPIEGLTIGQLSGCSATIWGVYGLPDRSEEPGQWVGSAFGIGALGDTLFMFTNRHCLGIDDFVSSGAVLTEADQYGLFIEFPSGEIRQVDQCGFYMVSGMNMDLAVLTVDIGGLIEGYDYTLVPIYPLDDLQVGDEVAASGSPADVSSVYAGTVTFGRVSAFRELDGTPVIQVDASVNHGNSGGPLLVERADHYYCVGVNAWGPMTETIEGISFAIDIRRSGNILQTGEIMFFRADGPGLCRALADAGYEGAVVQDAPLLPPPRGRRVSTGASAGGARRVD
ncbi:serine protease [Candidatus Fermentibacterales bacterium]|nr:serine protease [Candidatus Fermentibacterales bacterium]